jgi:hypothetical protein
MTRDSALRILRSNSDEMYCNGKGSTPCTGSAWKVNNREKKRKIGNLDRRFEFFNSSTY